MNGCMHALCLNIFVFRGANKTKAGWHRGMVPEAEI